MARSILQERSFRLVFALCWPVLGVLQLMVLHHYGFEWRWAIYDSIISMILMAGVALLITITLQYYNPNNNRHGYLAGLVTILSVLWISCSRGILMLLMRGTPDYNSFFSQSFPLRFMFGLLILGCLALVCVLWYTIQDQQTADARKTEAEQLSKDAELYKLRQQLQPHFLFNSLNSINALVTANPEKARKMIQQLSEFLRGTLKKEEHQWNSLTEELQHLQLYLDIEKVRFGHRLQTELINDTPADTQVPALLLQPVVENAIKFGLYDTTGDIMISLHATVDKGYVTIAVTNPFDPETTPRKRGTGFGLSSISRRMYLLFGRKDLLQTNAIAHLFTTTILIPPVQS